MQRGSKHAMSAQSVLAEGYNLNPLTQAQKHGDGLEETQPIVVSNCILLHTKKETNLGSVIPHSKASPTTEKNQIEPVWAICPLTDGSLNIKHIIRHDLGGGLLPSTSLAFACQQV